MDWKERIKELITLSPYVSTKNYLNFGMACEAVGGTVELVGDRVRPVMRCILHGSKGETFTIDLEDFTRYVYIEMWQEGTPRMYLTANACDIKQEDNRMVLDCTVVTPKNTPNEFEVKIERTGAGYTVETKYSLEDSSGTDIAFYRDVEEL